MIPYGIAAVGFMQYTYEKEIVMYAYFKKLDYFSTGGHLPQARLLWSVCSPSARVCVRVWRSPLAITQTERAGGCGWAATRIRTQPGLLCSVPSTALT